LQPLLFFRLQIRDIAAYYKMKVGSSSAHKITDHILEAIDKLADFPEMGMVPPWKMITDAGYRVLVVGDYLCFYQVVNDIVFVSHIAHTNTDYIKKIF